MGFEPMSTGFADQRVNHFAIGASTPRAKPPRAACNFRGSFTAIVAGMLPIVAGMLPIVADAHFGCAVVRRYGFTVL